MLMPGCPVPTWVENKGEVTELIKKVRRAQIAGTRVAVDTETTGLDIINDRVIIWSLCFEENSRYCLPASVLFMFKDLFANKKHQWVFTNAKYDMHMLANMGVPIEGRVYDTLVMSFLHDENRYGLHGLKQAARIHLGIEMPSFKEVFGKKVAKGKVAEALMDKLAEDKQAAVAYASLDAWATYMLSKVFEHKLKKENYKDLWPFIEKLYTPFTRVLYDMERRGVLINVDYLNKLKVPLKSTIANLERDFATKTKKVINLDSPKQLQKLFFEELKRKPIKVSPKTRKPSVDESVLSQWADDGDELATIILERRKYKKILSTYINGLTKVAGPDNRIHTTYNQHVARTGRLSSRTPNLQNIPRKGEWGARLRDTFIAAKGKKLICLDYSQLEIRVLAHMSKDKNMIKLIKDGKDLHSGSVELMFGYPYEEVVKAKKMADENPEAMTEKQKEFVHLRSNVIKTIAFGLIYGMGVTKLAKSLDISIDQARHYRDLYFKPYAQVEQFIDEKHSLALSAERVDTILGRPRRLYHVNAGGAIRAAAERQAVNAPIQGSAADIVMLAMLECANSDELKKLDAQMLLQVHDEIVFEVPEENAEKAVPIIKHLMENVLSDSLRVPLEVDGGIGDTWQKAK